MVDALVATEVRRTGGWYSPRVPEGGYRDGPAMAWRPNILFIANPIAGGGRAARLAERLASAIGPSAATARVIHSQPANAVEWLPSELGVTDLAVVVGGDGAIRQSAPLLAERGVALWHAAAGTENLFARSLGMRADAGVLALAIRAARVASIDVAEALPHDGAGESPVPFLLMASCGFDADVVHRLAEVRRGAISHLSYAGPILATLRRYRPPRVRVSRIEGASDGSFVESSVDAAGVVIANGPRYALGIDPVPAARLDDRLLHAVILPGTGAMSALSWGVRCFLRRAPGSLASASFQVQCDRPCRWQLDGDAAPWGEVAGVQFRLARSRLRVLLPAPTATDGGERSRAMALVDAVGDSIVSPSDEEEHHGIQATER